MDGLKSLQIRNAKTHTLFRFLIRVLIMIVIEWFMERNEMEDEAKGGAIIISLVTNDNMNIYERTRTKLMQN